MGMITSRKIGEKLGEYLKKTGESENAFAKRLGIQQSSVNKLIKNQQGVSFENAMKIMEVLGYSLVKKFEELVIIRRIGANSPTEIVGGEYLVPIPVYEQAGAGAGVDIFSWEPERIIYVMPQYSMKNVRAIEVTGDSMEPVVNKGAFVGVVPVAGELEEGHIYLVRRPQFGLVVKRVLMSEDGKIVLRSENKNYPDQPIPNEGYDGIIVGKVVWVWQMVELVRCIAKRASIMEIRYSHDTKNKVNLLES
jgi:phage repressor protein C with HTH and peptisase S24 domain